MLNHFPFCFLLFSILGAINAPAQSNWPQFRGPDGSGIAPGDKAAPVIIDASKNLLWESAISSGHSSPAIWGNRIFLTGHHNNNLETLCIDRTTGDILWRELVPGFKPERVHRVNSLATPTPVTDGERVYVYFGSYGLLCYTVKGEPVWRKPLKEIPRNIFGAASSPILANDYLIFMCENQTASFIEAINKKTGQVIWHRDREGFKSSWSTPTHWSNNGTDELLIYSVFNLSALDLKDGSDRWFVPGLADEPTVVPTLGEGLIFVSSYNMKTNTEVIGVPTFAKMLADYDTDKDGLLSYEEGKANQSVLSRFDADGEGDHPIRIFYRQLDEDKDQKISAEEYAKLLAWIDGFPQENGLVAIRPAARPGEKAEIVWRHQIGVPECPSPLYYKGRVYLVKNGGMVTCLKASNGAKVFQGRLGSGGPYYASPVVAGGNIYMASARGVVTVLKAGDTLTILARNDLSERMMATPAVLDGHIYIRTQSKLKAFGGQL